MVHPSCFRVKIQWTNKNKSTFNMPLSWTLQGSYDMISSHSEMFPLAWMLQSSPQACGASDCTGQRLTQHWGAQWAPPPQKCRNSLKCILSSAFLRGGGEMYTLSSDRQASACVWPQLCRHEVSEGWADVPRPGLPKKHLTIHPSPAASSYSTGNQEDDGVNYLPQSHTPLCELRPRML